MKSKNILTISISFRRENDIKEVEALTKEIAGAFKQAGIYLIGLRSVAQMLNKAKNPSK